MDRTVKIHWGRLPQFLWLLALLLLANYFLRLHFLARFSISLLFGAYFQYAIGPIAENQSEDQK